MFAQNSISMNVLLIGSGGREHAIAWKLTQSKNLSKLYIAPGNAGTARLGVNIEIGSTISIIWQSLLLKKILS